MDQFLKMGKSLESLVIKSKEQGVRLSIVREPRELPIPTK
jgi:hypothetical protein